MSGYSHVVRVTRVRVDALGTDTQIKIACIHIYIHTYIHTYILTSRDHTRSVAFFRRKLSSQSLKLAAAVSVAGTCIAAVWIVVWRMEFGTQVHDAIMVCMCT